MGAMARITRIRAARHLVIVDLENQTVSQQIRVSWARCLIGGSRPWLHCLCGRRVLRLFRGLGGYYCRPCVGNPIYASQGKSAQARRHFQACKLRLRLGGVASISEPFPKKPRGMHRKTYDRLRHRVEKLESGLSHYFKTKPPDYKALVYYFP
jgi:hypothetical protein